MNKVKKFQNRNNKFTKMCEEAQLRYFELNYPMTEEESKSKKYKYWNKYPLRKDNNTQIIDYKNKDLKHMKLPDIYEWHELDPNNNIDIKELTSFLNHNYIEDRNGLFRTVYDENLLKWILTYPTNNLHLCVRTKKSKKIVGFISMQTILVQLYEEEYKTCEINFLCVHKKIRLNKLTPVMIDELLKRCVDMLDYQTYTSVFSSMNYIPTPVSLNSVKIYHRPINIEKLMEYNYCSPANNDGDKDRIVDYYRIYKHSKSTLVKLNSTHVDKVLELLNNYMTRYNYYQKYLKNEFIHTFLDNDHMCSYVYVDDDGEVKDFISYYKTKTIVLNEKKYINEGHLYLYTSVNNTIYKLFNELLVNMASDDIDVVIVMNIMENSIIIEDKFEKGEHYYYYLVNMNCMKLKNTQICKLCL